MTEDEMVGWHHQLGEHEFDQAPGVGDGQGGLACCSSWGHNKSDMTDRLNSTEHSVWRLQLQNKKYIHIHIHIYMNVYAATYSHS